MSLFIGDAQEMYVLALVTQKGGSGKSTLAVGLAVAAMENGARVAFVEAAIPTLIAIRRFKRRFAFVLNQTPPRGCRLSEAATSLNSLGVLALPYVGQRNDHQDALGTGLGVTEFAQEGRASEEVRELWRWVLKKLVVGSLDHEPHAKKAAC